jgi:enamine deaminase RidA (YjgF/YER057c/UK114 family)
VAATITRLEPEGGILSNLVAARGLVTIVSLADDTSLDCEGQTREALGYIDRCLGQIGADKRAVVQATIWLSDIRHRDAMNRAWMAWADARHMPARACVEARLARPEYLVEMAVVAAVAC